MQSPGIVGEIIAEAQCAAGSGWLEKRELFKTQFTPELDGMAPARPAQVVSEHITVLLFYGRQVCGAPDGLIAIGESKRGQATDVGTGRKRNSLETVCR